MGIAEDVVQLVAEAAGIDASTIRSDSELWTDLHIGGDDMLELFLNLQKKFGMNLDGLDLSTYSPSEDDALVTQVSEWFATRLHLARRQRYTSMRVADLISAAQSGSWSGRR
jgi:acyl carrier protein